MVDVSSIKEGLLDGLQAVDAEEEFTNLQERALKYLRAKFPGVDEKVFYMHYSGHANETLPTDLVATVLECETCEKLCSTCQGPKNCQVHEFLKSYLRPLITLRTNNRGVSFLEVRKSIGLRCKFGAYDIELSNRIRKSGIAGRQLTQTFGNYEPRTEQEQLAKSYMMALSRLKENVILAGRRGTGKSHLAVAFAIQTIKEQNARIRFELVAEMLDKIRRAIFERQDYFSLIEDYKRADYLILDDLGKEKQTDAASDYLFQIIDSRYRSERPTIITTNARTPDELISWGRPDVYAPMISRLLENGSWIPFLDGSDYRLRGLTGGQHA